ncbi:MAG: MetQ/NlpA family ABC transporter substrate-binding protein [Lachnospiraceae bacterium]
MKKLTVLSTVLALALSTAALTGCGSAAEAAPEAAAPETVAEAPAAEETPAEEETPAAEEEAPAAEGGIIKVAASATPHAEILEQVKDTLAAEGWDLQVTVFDDYVQPNLVVESGEFDANYFQHIPYLTDFNAENETHLVEAAQIHYEPFGIYPGVSSDLANIADGAKIAVPNDTTNEARALLLLQDNGLITLKDGIGLEATVKDIVENPKNIEIIELEAAQVSRVIDEVDFVVLNGNYAMEAGLSVGKDAVAAEAAESEAAQTYANILVVEEGNENAPGIQALVKALQSDAVRDYISNTYDGAVVPIF